MQRSQISASSCPVGMFVSNLYYLFGRLLFFFFCFLLLPVLEELEGKRIKKKRGGQRETVSSLLTRPCHRRPLGVYLLPVIA